MPSIKGADVFFVRTACSKAAGRFNVCCQGKRKQGGARLITYAALPGETVYLISVYDKAERENRSEAELLKIRKDLP